VLVAEKDSQIEALNREINKMGTELDKIKSEPDNMLNNLKTVLMKL